MFSPIGARYWKKEPAGLTYLFNAAAATHAAALPPSPRRAATINSTPPVTIRISNSNAGHEIC